MARSRGKAAAARYLRFNATRQGLLGGSKPWLAVFVLLRLAKQVNKVTKRGEMPLVFSEKLEPGASYVITHIVPLTRKQRRRAKKTG